MSLGPMQGWESEWGRGGGGWGEEKINKKNKKKVAILSKNDDFGEVVEVPGISKKKTVKILKINWLYS